MCRTGAKLSRTVDIVYHGRRVARTASNQTQTGSVPTPRHAVKAFADAVVCHGYSCAIRAGIRRFSASMLQKHPMGDYENGR